ncbi:MAG: hypothetical protein LBP72_01395 [Dysgonamonadaceae bacterium]|jgi:hypothetical protein|nr:hypothetical protein [Dysgonamonadaceae bacterium]
MRTIKCNECGKILFETESESNGAAGAEAQEKGFIYKNACLFSDKYSSLFFCKEECFKSFYDREIPKNKTVSKILKEMKNEIPDMAKEVAKGLSELTEVLKKYKVI